uniref:Uncharacterized protein n=1 Tax=Anguilla anguilla TaxID=7936 RepID=A0A0E9WPI6_ANGAN
MRSSDRTAVQQSTVWLISHTQLISHTLTHIMKNFFFKKLSSFSFLRSSFVFIRHIDLLLCS